MWLMEALKPVPARLWHSILTLPDWSSSQTVLLQCAMAAAVLALVGFVSGASWQPIKDSKSIGWLAAYALARAAVEELVWRSAMLPHQQVDGPYTGISAFFGAAMWPLTLSTASHVWTTQRAPNIVAKDAPFLFAVAGASTLYTLVYYTSGGSFVLPFAIHVLFALPCLVWFGGHKKLHTPPMLKKRKAGEGLAPSGTMPKAD